jgi:hypothetical protein
MYNRTKFTTTLILSTVIVAIATICALSFTHTARAQDEPRRLVNVLPGVGLADGQTLLVTFVNIGSNPFEIIPCIFDGDGAHLKTGAAVTLMPGKMSSLEMSRSEAPRSDGSVRVRAGVHINDENLKYLLVSGELVDDATAKSSLFLPGEKPPAIGVPGDIEPVLPAVNITFGQTFRVTMLNVGSNPLEFDPCLLDGDGAHIKMGERITLQPGQMRTFDLSRAEAGPRAGNRLPVRFAAHISTADLKYLRVSGEVVEDSTSRATLFMPPVLTKSAYVSQ